MATDALTLTPEAFSEMVLREHLPTWQANGYVWTGRKGQNGWELFKTFLKWEGIPLSTTTTANPAAGANPAALTCPAGHRYLVTKMLATLTTDATAANRRVRVVVSDGTVSRAEFIASTNHTASIVLTYTGCTASVNTGLLATGGSWVIGFDVDGIIVPEGWSVQFTTINIVAGDDWSACVYTYKDVLWP